MKSTQELPAKPYTPEVRSLRDTFLVETLEAIPKDAKNIRVVYELPWRCRRGDRFLDTSENCEYILARVNDKNGDDRINLISLADGNIWSNSVKVKSCMDVSFEEFQQLIKGYANDFVRIVE